MTNSQYLRSLTVAPFGQSFGSAIENTICNLTFITISAKISDANAFDISHWSFREGYLRSHADVKNNFTRAVRLPVFRLTCFRTLRAPPRCFCDYDRTEGSEIIRWDPTAPSQSWIGDLPVKTSIDRKRMLSSFRHATNIRENSKGPLAHWAIATPERWDRQIGSPTMRQKGADGRHDLRATKPIAGDRVDSRTI
jgi:hypothetical protein